MKTALALCLLSLCSFAMAENASQFDLRKITCAELNAMPDEDQGYVLVLILGYSVGAEGRPVQTSASITDRITSTHRNCAVATEQTVLDIMLMKDSL